MAGITQTIPSFTAGISEQPDALKSPGQVKNVLNAIPDLTYGLYKRPGSKRVGTDPIATNKYGTSAIPAGGSWFHYYRDSTEGAYIGNVDANGFVRIWSCNDGTEKNVWYITDNTVYNASTSAHTQISSATSGNETNEAHAHYRYLSSSTPESIQALTVNDTTFLVNRDRTVKTTGTTTGYADNHFAYIELKRTENGRQYGLNISNPGTDWSNDGNLTSLSRATRLKINSNTQATGDGTGHCPGIGTQVFAVTDGSKKNLIFRITALGQQGSSTNMNINSDDNHQHAEDYSCTYNNKIELLHGGEGWALNDTQTVTLDQALTNYNFVVKVMKIETTKVKADIKAVRPEPTPFDADTAVTVDTILGGILTELSGLQAGGQNINARVIGNGIYLSCANAFSVEAVNLDLLNVVGKEVNDVTKLPNQCKHNYIVKVVNSSDSTDDDYWLKFKGDNNVDGPGSWVECPEPGIVKSFNAATMPHILQRQADGDFLLKQYSWADREVGDDTTNPLPTFADGSSKINKVLFFRNRLAFLSGENVCTSRAGKYGNFWADTALAVSAVDPIDITSSSTFPSELFDGIEIGQGLLVFSTNQQFLFSTDADVLNPDTAKLRPVSTYNYNKVVSPISLGTTVAYIDNSGKYSRFMEMANTGREADATVVEQSKVAPSLLPKSIDLLTNSRENSLIFFGKSDTDTIYGFRYFNIGGKREQSSWFKWKFNNKLKYHFAIDDDYFFLDEDNFLNKVSLVQQDTDASIDKDGINYLINLDNWTTVTGGVYDNSTNLTTFTNKATWIPSVSTPNGTLVVVDTDGSDSGRYAHVTLTGNNPNDDFTLPGDWSSGTFKIGYLYDYQVDLPRLYVTKQVGQNTVADVNASLILHRMKFNFGKVGLYETTLTRIGKADYTEVYESSILNAYNATTAPFLEQEIRTVPVYDRNENVNITLKSTHPSPCTFHALSWEGDYTNKFYTRA